MTFKYKTKHYKCSNLSEPKTNGPHRQDQILYKILAERVFQDKNKLVWVQLNDFNQPRKALYLLSRYRKDSMCEAQNGALGGHNAAHKMYLKISTSYFWPKMKQDIDRHISLRCLRCQQRKKSTNQPTPLAPLPIPEHPNLQIHADLFGPMITADSYKKFLLCFTDAFTKYAVVTKMLKRWPTPFTEIASPNSEFRPRFTLTEARNLSISSRRSFTNS
jgi:hypothetical protein